LKGGGVKLSNYMACVWCDEAMTDRQAAHVSGIGALCGDCWWKWRDGEKGPPPKPRPVGPPVWLDLPQTIEWLRWILTAGDAELDQWRNGELAPKVIDRACRVLAWVEGEQQRRRGEG
jgi:hypothetical protein